MLSGKSTAFSEGVLTFSVLDERSEAQQGSSKCSYIYIYMYPQCYSYRRSKYTDLISGNMAQLPFLSSSHLHFMTTPQVPKTTVSATLTAEKIQSLMLLIYSGVIPWISAELLLIYPSVAATIIRPTVSASCRSMSH